MQIGDIVAVVDHASPRRGMWGVFSHTTRAGRMVVNFIDGSVEPMDPFQVEDYEGLASAAVIARQAWPVRRGTPAPPVVQSGRRHTAGNCRCGHPEYKHREYHGYVACTCPRAAHRQCRCRAFNPLPLALQTALRELHDATTGRCRDAEEGKSGRSRSGPGRPGRACRSASQLRSVRSKISVMSVSTWTEVHCPAWRRLSASIPCPAPASRW